MVVLITRSVEQSQDLERSTQVFFAIESGLEAGFFHHNARGQGVDFLDIGETGFPTAQIITHSYTTLDSGWTIKGRADVNNYYGMIYENTPLQLRWFWDSSTVVTDRPSTHETNLTPDFTLYFDPTNPSLDASDFGSLDTEVLLSWLLTKRADGAIQSLTPFVADSVNSCVTTESSFFCDDDFSRDFSSSSGFIGRLIPRTDSNTTESVNSFISNGDPAPTNFQLVLSPTLKFEKEGIPFKLTGTQALPLPYYSVSTSVTAGDFTKDLVVSNIPEQTILQAFNYVIFD